MDNEAPTNSKARTMLSLHVTVTVAPENVEKFLEIMRPAYDMVITEPECTFFEVFVSDEEPGVLRWVEGWTKDWQWIQEVVLSFPFSQMNTAYIPRSKD
jgi:hypothetical protein